MKLNKKIKDKETCSPRHRLLVSACSRWHRFQKRGFFDMDDLQAVYNYNRASKSKIHNPYHYQCRGDRVSFTRFWEFSTKHKATYIKWEIYHEYSPGINK